MKYELGPVSFNTRAAASSRFFWKKTKRRDETSTIRCFLIAHVRTYLLRNATFCNCSSVIFNGSFFDSRSVYLAWRYEPEVPWSWQPVRGPGHDYHCCELPPLGVGFQSCFQWDWQQHSWLHETKLKNVSLYKILCITLVELVGRWIPRATDIAWISVFIL